MKTKLFMLFLALVSSVGSIFASNIRYGISNKNLVSGLITCDSVYRLNYGDEIALNDVTVTYVNGKFVWAKDDTGSIQISLSSAVSWHAGDILSGVRGRITIFRGLYTIQPSVDQAAAITATAGEVPEPEELINVPEITDMNKYVIIKNVIIEGEFNTSSKSSLNATLGDTTFVLQNRFQLAQTFEANALYDIVGVIYYVDNLSIVEFISATRKRITPIITPENCGSATVNYNTITVTPNYGYHFVQWSDGNTDNPRTIVLIRDTTITAEFAKNDYTVATAANNSEWGTTNGDTTVLYLDTITISAIPNYGYHFVKWKDNNTANPRTITVTKDQTFQAIFAKNTYSITKQYDAKQGYVNGPSQAEYSDTISLTANPNYGYHFVQWNDGVTDNPRTIVLIRDTTITAEFAKNEYLITTESSNAEWGTTTGDTTALYLYEVQISATPNYGYHFVRWNDNSTSNPRTITVTQNQTFQAIFAKNTYSITKQYDANQGYVNGPSQAEYLDTISLTVYPNYGYHFVQWYDGVTDNPRSFVLTQDSTFTAECAKNEYTITTESSNLEWGVTAGDTIVPYMEQIQISATPNYGYHFVQWSDGVTDNPRTIQITENKAYHATFAKNTYTISKDAYAVYGSITGPSRADYLDSVTLTVYSNYGYHFMQWSDSVTDNPRTIVLTSDTTLVALFATDKNGRCGNGMALKWAYDSEKYMLTISGEGAFDENMQCGVEAKSEMTHLVIDYGVTSIGENAFMNCANLRHVDIAETVKTIHNNAFYGCANVNTIVNYRPTPTNVYSTTFDGIDKFECALFVLDSAITLYKNAAVWRDFYHIKAIGAEEITIEEKEVTTEVGANSVVITWPTDENAETYSLEIIKEGEIVCTLTFNSYGQLMGIAFAQASDGRSHTPAATLTTNGMQFMVTGLNSGTLYNFEITAMNSDTILASYSGEFETIDVPETPETPMDVDIIDAGENVQKILLYGTIYILRGDIVYTLQGQEVR